MREGTMMTPWSRMTVEEKLEALRAESAPRRSVVELAKAVADLNDRVSKIEKKMKGGRG
jgi:hypothetical protein